jgi:hypothetical protein
MLDGELEALFPDDYEKRPMKMADEIRDVNLTNLLDYAGLANRYFEFFMDNPNKPGYYFVDWRIVFSSLDEFLKTFNVYSLGKEGMLTLSKFQRYYDISGGVMYERFGIVGDDRDEGELIL